MLDHSLNQNSYNCQAVESIPEFWQIFYYPLLLHKLLCLPLYPVLHLALILRIAAWNLMISVSATISWLSISIVHRLKNISKNKYGILFDKCEKQENNVFYNTYFYNIFLFIHVKYVKFIVFTVVILLCFFTMFSFLCALYFFCFVLFAVSF